MGQNLIKTKLVQYINNNELCNKIEFDNGVLKIDLSKDLLDVKAEIEEKLIESIVYTLTSIDGIDKVILYVEGDILNKLPQTGKTFGLPFGSTLPFLSNRVIPSSQNISGVAK